MTIDEEIDQFETDLTGSKANDDALFRRGLFLAGELDLTGQTVASVLARPKDGNERLFNLLGQLGTLVGKDRENDAVTMGPITAVVENLP